MDTTQKAPIIVTQPDGTPVTGFTAGVDNGTAFIQALGPNVYLVAQAVGSGVLTVTAGAQTGTLPFTITAAPLTVTLGVPIPKE